MNEEITIHKPKGLIDIDDLTEIRDAIIIALNDLKKELLENFSITIKVVGKINKSGITAIFEIKPDQVKNLLGKKVFLKNLVEKIKDKIIEWKNKLKELTHLKSIELSFGLDLKIFGELSITITLEKK